VHRRAAERPQPARAHALGRGALRGSHKPALPPALQGPGTSPLRAPFTRYDGTSGPAEVSEEVRGSGARKAVGELFTCPFCTGLWASTGLAAGLVFAPRATRLAAGTLTALVGSDLLHFLRARLQQATEN
jgi:hypothetical protein